MEHATGPEASAQGAIDPALARLLSHLIEFEYDTISAYETALDRVEDWQSLQTLRASLEDHRQHVRELSQVVTVLGGQPPHEGDVRGLMIKGRVLLAGIIGDRAVLRALHKLEEQTNLAFEHALDYPALPPGVREVLVRGLSHERNHRQWISMQTDEL